MKNIFLLAFLTIMCSCSLKKSFNYYHGYVFNQNNNPIINIEVFEKDRPLNKSLTDNKGYFKIEKNKNSISTFLMVKRNNILVDSIQVIRSSGGEKINYYFVEGRNDTLFIDMKY